MNMEMFFKAFELAGEFSEKANGLDDIAFMSMIGILINRYAANHHIPGMELHEYIYKAAKEVFEELGEMEPQ